MSTPRVSKPVAKAGVVVGALLLTTGAAVSAASIQQVGSGWPAVYLLGNDHNESHSCADLAEDLVANGILQPPAPTWLDFKIDNPTKGGDYDGPLDVTISSFTTTGFDWSSGNGTGVDLVYVKSGVGASKVFLYDPPTEATSGTGLTVDKDISHITFCYDEGGATTTTSTSTTTTTASTTTTTASTTTTEPTTTTTEGTTTTTEPTTTTTEGTTTTTEPTTTTTEGTTTTTEATTSTTSATSTSTPTTTEPTTTTGPTTTVPGTTSTSVGGVSSTKPTSTVPGTTTTTLVVTPVSGDLPRTGLGVGALLAAAGALMAAGGAVTLSAHRRLEQDAGGGAS